MMAAGVPEPTQAYWLSTLDSTTPDEWVRAIDSCRDDNGVVSLSINNATGLCYVIKRNFDGSLQWAKSLTSASFTIDPFDVSVADTGEIYVCGNTGQATPKAWLVCFDSDGTLLFKKDLDDTLNANLVSGQTRVKALSGGDVIFAYTIQNGAFLYRINIARIEPDGTIDWQTYIEGFGPQSAFDVNESDGEIVIIGHNYDDDPFRWVKLDIADGDTTHFREASSPTFDGTFNIFDVCHNNSYYFAVGQFSQNGWTSGVAVLRFSHDGVMGVAREFPNASSDSETSDLSQHGIAAGGLGIAINNSDEIFLSWSTNGVFIDGLTTDKASTHVIKMTEALNVDEQVRIIADDTFTDTAWHYARIRLDNEGGLLFGQFILDNNFSLVGRLPQDFTGQGSYSGLVDSDYEPWVYEAGIWPDKTNESTQSNSNGSGNTALTGVLTIADSTIVVATPSIAVDIATIS